VLTGAEEPMRTIGRGKATLPRPMVPGGATIASPWVWAATSSARRPTVRSVDARPSRSAGFWLRVSVGFHATASGGSTPDVLREGRFEVLSEEGFRSSRWAGGACEPEPGFERRGDSRLPRRARKLARPGDCDHVQLHRARNRTHRAGTSAARDSWGYNYEMDAIAGLRTSYVALEGLAGERPKEARAETVWGKARVRRTDPGSFRGSAAAAIR
jgi:hypothetical protein